MFDYIRWCLGPAAAQEVAQQKRAFLFLLFLHRLFGVSRDVGKFQSKGTEEVDTQVIMKLTNLG